VLRYCSSLPCSANPDSGPSVGHGGTGDFARVNAPAWGEETASLTSYFNIQPSSGSPDCVDAVDSISLYYHLWSPYGICRGELFIQQQLNGGAWTTVATASVYQAAQDDPWLPLSHTFFSPYAVTGVRLLADPTTGPPDISCYNFASVSIDDVIIDRTTTCGLSSSTYCGTARPSASPTPAPTLGPGETYPPSTAPTYAPTAAPSTAAPATSKPSAAPSVAATSIPTTYNIFPSVPYGSHQFC
jgi:hypothetical protein